MRPRQSKPNGRGKRRQRAAVESRTCPGEPDAEADRPREDGASELNGCSRVSRLLSWGVGHLTEGYAMRSIAAAVGVALVATCLRAADDRPQHNTLTDKERAGG